MNTGISMYTDHEKQCWFKVICLLVELADNIFCDTFSEPTFNRIGFVFIFCIFYKKTDFGPKRNKVFGVWSLHDIG